MADWRLPLPVSYRDSVCPANSSEVVFKIEIYNFDLSPSTQCPKALRDFPNTLGKLNVETCLLCDADVLGSSFLSNLVLKTRCCYWPEVLNEAVLNGMDELDGNE